MNKDDVVMIYGNPIKKESPIGEAKLISKLSVRSKKLEYWQVAFVNDENVTFNVFINTEKDGKNKP
jgi:hypothetical protein